MITSIVVSAGSNTSEAKWGLVIFTFLLINLKIDINENETEIALQALKSKNNETVEICLDVIDKCITNGFVICSDSVFTNLANLLKKKPNDSIVLKATQCIDKLGKAAASIPSFIQAPLEKANIYLNDQ